MAFVYPPIPSAAGERSEQLARLAHELDETDHRPRALARRSARAMLTV